MKTIQVTDEMYNDLVKLSKEYTTQDNRGTRMPYLFQVRDKQRVYYMDVNQGSNQIWHDGESIVEDFEDLKDYLDSFGFEYTDKEEGIIKLIFESWTQKYLFRREDISRDEFFKKYCPDLKEGSYSIEEIYTNAFFTAKCCKEHIQNNRHHYHEPIDYLNYADRNPEMELISNFLCEISKTNES